MRRLAIVAVTSLALVALVATSVSARPAASFTARANHAEQGAQLRVAAKVKHSVRLSTFSASAVVHFASGDVAVTLTPHGKSFNASGAAAVAADEAVGPVAVDVTITYNGVDQFVSTWGAVQPADDESDDSDTDN
jgi:hypothetical protein